MALDYLWTSSRTFGVLTCVLASSMATGQEHCNALLDHGINDIARQKSAAHAIAYKWHSYCGMDMQSASDQRIKSASAGVFGWGSGSADSNTSSTRTRLKQWCDQNQAFAQTRQELFVEASVVSSASLTAWNKCQEFAAKNVTISMTPSGAHSRFVHFEIDSKSDANLTFLGIETRNMTCKTRMVGRNGNVINFRNQPKIDNTNIQIDCERTAPKTAQAQGFGTITFEESYVSINTSGPALPVAFGRVVSSYAVTPPNSVLAFDSSTCPAGWEPYEQAYGRFIRGIDLGKTKTDPDGQRQPGSPQEDELKSHTHTITKQRPLVHRNHGGSRGEDLNPGGWANHTQLEVDAAGGPETRPKNVALLFCKRVVQ